MDVSNKKSLYAQPDQSLMTLIRQQTSGEINTPAQAQKFPNKETKEAIMKNEAHQADLTAQAERNHARIERMREMQKITYDDPHRQALNERKGHHVNIQV